MTNLNHLCFHCFKEKGAYTVCQHCGHVAGTLPAQAYYLMPGTVLMGRYIIGTVIGFGGFGITYKAFDAKLDMVIAVKEFYPRGIVNRPLGGTRIEIFTQKQASDYQHMLGRFLDEAKNMAKFSKEQDIIAVYDHFEENQTAYIVMEYLEGIQLGTYLKEYGPMQAQEAIPLFLELLDALGKLHEQGIIHRDVSPGNLFITEKNRIKLFDFGAASFRGSPNDGTHEVVIKAGYTPPEQYRKDMAPKETMDVYAAGALLYEMLTGESPPEAIDRMVQDELVTPSQMGSAIGKNLENAILKALALNPEDRFASAREFYESIAESKTVELKPSRKMPTVFKWMMGSAAVFTLVIVGIMFGLYQADLTNYIPKEGTTLQVWLVQDEGKGEADTTGEMEDRIRAGFEERYPLVNLQITSVPKEEYAKKLEETPDEDLPDVYCTDYMEADRFNQCLDLTKLVKKLDTVSYLFTEQYLEQYPVNNQVPTGFQLAAYYRNVTKEDLGNGIDRIELGELKLSEKNNSYEWVDSQKTNQKTYKALSKGGKPLNSVIGSVSCWKDVQDATISGEGEKSVELQIVPVVEQDKLLCSFNNCYAVKRTGDDNRQKTGMLFLYYLLGNVAQREMYLKRGDSLPVNARAYREYMENLTQYRVTYIEENIHAEVEDKVSIRISNNVEMDGESYGVYQAYAGNSG